VLQEVDRAGKESLITFLYKAGLLPAVALTGADLRGVVLRIADLDRANLERANLRGAKVTDEQLGPV
jgi:uncharacterized protein YjbI with pentapeptide repeats